MEEGYLDKKKYEANEKGVKGFQPSPLCTIVWVTKGGEEGLPKYHSLSQGGDRNS